MSGDLLDGVQWSDFLVIHIELLEYGDLRHGFIGGATLLLYGMAGSDSY